GRFADGINRGVHFRRRIVHGHAAGLLLLLLLGIVHGQVGRDALPRLAVIARTEQELCADVDGPLFIRRQRDWRVPVEPEFFVVIWSRLDVARLMCLSIYPPDFAALVFGINVIRIGGVGEHPETVAVVHVFPLRVGDAAGIL